MEILLAGLLFLPLSQCLVEPTIGRPWPLPQCELTDPEDSLTFTTAKFNFATTGNDCDILEEAYDRYENLILGENSLAKQRAWIKRKFPHLIKEAFNVSKEAVTLEVNILQPCDKNPHLFMNEQYELRICYDSDVTRKAMKLISLNVWGALRGLETFSQLLIQSKEMDNSYTINCTQILDFPRFYHRGVMLDTSRHFLPVNKILENLDLMAMNKMNVFHWHIVDHESFPYVSAAYPELSNKGSYSKLHIYSPEQVESIIEYARVRGIRVIPEFDTPGHTKSWGLGEPNLLTECYGKDGEPNGEVGPIDPTIEENYLFLKNLFTEILTKFKDVLHIGGDEVNFSCWKSNPNITDFMQKENITSYKGLESYYITRLYEVLATIKPTAGNIVWQELFDDNVAMDKNTIVQVWKNQNLRLIQRAEMAAVTAAGYPAILSACYYLNYITYGIDWHKYYECDPQDFLGSAHQKSLVLGGEACMWGEFVDATNLIPRLWPRASVVAEKLWSAEAATKDTKAAESRLQEHRCRLLRRGFAVQPINGPSFCP